MENPCVESEGCNNVFDAIVVTASTVYQAHSFQLELKAKQDHGLLPRNCVLVSVPDPSGVRIGSGGATLNALYVASRELCRSAGYATIDQEYVKTKRILILHSGGDSQRIPICSVRGKAFSTLPTKKTGLVTASPFDFLVDIISSICTSAPSGGCVVASSDVLLLLPTDESYVWRNTGITGLAIPTPTSTACNHGVYQASDNGAVTQFYQKPNIQQMQEANLVDSTGKVLVDSGIVFMSQDTTSKFLSLHRVEPFIGCMCEGIDDGFKPIRFELYTDFMLCLNPAVTFNELLDLPLPDSKSDRQQIQKMRTVLWERFHGDPFHVCIPQKESRFAHLGTTSEFLDLICGEGEEWTGFREYYALSHRVRTNVSYGDNPIPNNNVSPVLSASFGSGTRRLHQKQQRKKSIQGAIHKECVITSSILEEQGYVEKHAFIENSLLKGPFHIKTGAVCSSVRSVVGLKVEPHIALQEIHLSKERIQQHPYFHTIPKQSLNDHPQKEQQIWVIELYGVLDAIKANVSDPKATFLNQTWSNFFRRADCTAEDIWREDIPSSHRSLWNARLFPVLFNADTSVEHVLWMQHLNTTCPTKTIHKWKAAFRLSFQDILALSDPKEEFLWREQMEFDLDLSYMEHVLMSRSNASLLPLFEHWTDTRKKELLLSKLDEISSNCSLDVMARSLSAIADVLYSFPKASQERRAGPHCNPQWHSVYRSLAEFRSDEDQEQVIQQMKILRQQLMLIPEHIIRACRHYDGASQILIGRCVETTNSSPLTLTETEPLRHGEWLHVSSPVRLDIAGGWSDTPPISYEHGGSVVNVAIRVDGENPVGCSVRLIPDAIIRIREPRYKDESGSETSWDNRKNNRYVQEDDLISVCSFKDDKLDCTNPNARHALIKSVLASMNLISLPQSCERSSRNDAVCAPTNCATDNKKNEQFNPTSPILSVLTRRLGKKAGPEEALMKGVEIRTWSLLPRGSGLGVSSILAATLVKALYLAIGKNLNNDSVTKVVLKVEQLLSTGGGWQDQIGGIYPGFKITQSPPTFPLSIEPSIVDTNQELQQWWNEKVVIMYTGGTRLARDILQCVIRRWYHRGASMLTLVKDLVENAHKMSTALHKGDIPNIVECLNVYHSQKSSIVKEAEPDFVKQIISKIMEHDLALSVCSCGAGGGGFLMILMNENTNLEVMKTKLMDQLVPKGKASLHSISICTEGLAVHKDDSISPNLIL